MFVPEVGSIDYVKYLNVSRVLRLILHHQPISRTQLAEMSGLSKVTVSSCVDCLLEKQLIKQSGFGDVKRGRPRIQLCANERAGILVGVEAAVTHNRLIVTDFSGTLLEDKDLPGMLQGPHEFMRELAGELFRIYAVYTGYVHSLMGVGLSLFGHYSQTTGCIEYVASRKDWAGFPIQAEFQKYFPDLPLCCDRMSNLSAMGELCFGARDLNHMLAFLACSWGIGVGMFRYVEAAQELQSIPSRFGHTIIHVGGKLCSCGNLGCLEAYASTRALFEEIYPGEPASRERLNELLLRDQSGDHLVNGAVDRTLSYLAVGAANLINAYRPQELCIGGFMQSFLTEERLSALRISVEQMVPEVFRHNVTITTPQLGNLSSLYGCVASIRNRVLEYIP